MTIQSDLEDARDTLVAEAAKAVAIIEGPASGAGSTVSTENGTVSTLAKTMADAVAEFESTTGTAIADLEQAVTDAETAEAGAVAAESSAEAWAAAAQLAAQSNLFATLSAKDHTNSPVTVVYDTDDGTMFMGNTAGGSLDFQLPAVDAAQEGERYGFYRVSASNTMRLLRSGSDYINGVAGDYTFNAIAGQLVVVFADEGTPDNWIVMIWTPPAADGTTLTSSGGQLSVNVGNPNNWTAPQRAAALADNDGSFDLSAKQNFTCTPTGTIASLTFTNYATQAGQSGFIKWVNPTPYGITAFGAMVYGGSDVAAAMRSRSCTLGYFCDGTTVELFLAPAASALV